MKTIILLLLLPLFSFAQEMPVAIKSGGVWAVSAQVKTQAQLGMDSVYPTRYTVDTTFIQQDSLVEIVFHDGQYSYTSLLIGRNSNDTIYTQAMYACGVSCKNLNECVGGFCYTGSDCKCYCTGTGGCSEIWLSVFGEAPIGVVVRERILISNNHYIPEE